jgi:hypothetical protein
MNLTLWIIRFLHLLFVVFIIATPFVVSDSAILTLYLLISGLMMFHWIVDDDTCALTLLESWAMGSSKPETFVGRLVAPVYRVSNTEVKLVCLGLWMFALFRLIRNR